MDPVFRHVAWCNNATLPGGRIPLHIAGQPVGWVAPGLVPTLLSLGAVQDGGARDSGARDGGALHLVADQLQPIARALAAEGLFTWRDEAFDVRSDPASPALGCIDRGALPVLGIAAQGVHLNGLVLRGGAPHLWVARRAAHKLLDPGKLDHLVAGGIPAGLTPMEALLKEADEEAAIPAQLLQAATNEGFLDYALDRGEGLRRDRIHCYDLVLPESFTPEARDGEVESFALWPLPEVLDRVRHTDDFKFNVPLVLIGLFQRYGLLEG